MQFRQGDTLLRTGNSTATGKRTKVKITGKTYTLIRGERSGHEHEVVHENLEDVCTIEEVEVNDNITEFIITVTEPVGYRHYNVNTKEATNEHYFDFILPGEPYTVRNQESYDVVTKTLIRQID